MMLCSTQKLGQPIVDRYREAQDRPGAFQALGASLQLIGKAVEQYKNKVGVLLFLMGYVTGMRVFSFLTDYPVFFCLLGSFL